ncbi:Tigger transposable element-derived protein 4 [Araneus ventricosus]|uniref:Tigger transposable element-derived protein 4 n=1 Tax=Araneus ventricosus TaxID=182803 RepID=A0A4Y2W9H9_ARAVE|nr:Tigger transposable element-derived protein 4 [Araneus ventricosus]GBO33188.1 Tigger transposable element-derived protein 4 [Araneus ventricosus]
MDIHGQSRPRKWCVSTQHHSNFQPIHLGAKCPPVGVVRKFEEGVQAQVSSSSSDRDSKLWVRSQNIPCVASKRDANIAKLNWTGLPQVDESKKGGKWKLGHKDFKSRNGWLENFKNRHNIVFRKLCGESQSVSDELCSEWIKNLPALLQEYSLDNIFSADETGLFFKALPDKTAVFQGKTCHGGKQSKERVTLLLATNMSGTEKLTPLMIGKSRNPSVGSESDEEQELHTEMRQCEEWEKVSKILNLSETTTFEKFMEFDSEVQVCGLMMRSLLKQFLLRRVMRKRWMFQQNPTLLRLRLKMLFTYSDASWNVQKTWKKRTSQLFFGLKTW